jgi:xylose isomerase
MSAVNNPPQSTRRSHQELLQHLRSFELDLKFSAGIWFFSIAGSRFHDRYRLALDIPQRLDIASKLKADGLVALEAHYPNEINEENLDIWKQFVRDTGIRLVAVVPLLFYDSQFEWGSLSSPLPGAREAALDRTKRTLEVCKEVEADLMIVWPGIDGYENGFGMNFYEVRDRFAHGLAEALDAVPGIPLAFEPKPYEPRGRILYGTTSEALILAEKVEGMLTHPRHLSLLKQGKRVVGLNPEVGHMLMAYEDLAYSFSLAMEYDRLLHTHWNSQPLGNYDQDLNVGVVSPEQMEAALYALKMHGYRGYFGIDIYPERMSVEAALRNSMDALRAANDRVNSLDHERVLWATQNPHKGAGWLEAYLIRARALHPERLQPLPDPPQGD